MKKLFLTLLVATLMVSESNAQETEFGIKAGVNIATLTGDDVVENLDGRTGFHIGGLLHLGITESFAFQPELLFSSKGAEDLTLNYIDIPLLAHFHITEEFTVHAGPQLGFLLSAEDNGKDVKDFYSTTDLGLAAGATYRIESGLFFTARYNLGLSDIGEEFETDVTIGGSTTTIKSEFEAQNSVFQISAGYLF